jgi:hypothetical protein
MFLLLFQVSDIKYCKEQCSLANPTPVVPNDFDINIITLGEFYLKYAFIRILNHE